MQRTSTSEAVHFSTEGCLFHSPNHHPRRSGTSVDLVVIHCISLPAGHYHTGDWTHSAVHRLFMDPNSKLSAHWVIRRNGECIQYVSMDAVAYHAGVSEFQGRTGCNEFSLGIELEGYWEDPEGFTSEQYDRLNVLLTHIRHSFPHLSRQHLVGHQTIARWPEGHERPEPRRLDPGPYFGWDQIIVPD